MSRNKGPCTKHERCSPPGRLHIRILVKATLSAVRAYGTHAGYGEKPREMTTDSPVVLRAYPRRRWTTTISFGAPEAWVLNAEGLAQAALRTLFTGEFGRAQKGDPVALEKVQQLRQTFGPTGEEWRWWVTIACERDQEVPEDDWLDLPFVWVSPRLTDQLAAGARDETGRALDALVALIGATLPNSITGGPALDRVFMRATDRQAFALLTPTVLPPSIQMSSREPADVSRLGSALRRLRPELDRLESSMYWWARSIEERDHWRQFQFQFLGLEILTAKLERQARQAVIPTLRGGRGTAGVVPPQLVGERLSILSQFALVALMLSPATASHDVEVFAELKRTRDQLSHGDLPLRAELPTGPAAELLARYVARALTRTASTGGDL